MQERRLEPRPQSEITMEAVAGLAEQGLVDEVEWAISQMPGVKVVEVIPIKSHAHRVRSTQLHRLAGTYDDLYMLSDNPAWRDRMFSRSSELRSQAHAHYQEAERVEEINREGFAYSQTQEPA